MNEKTRRVLDTNILITAKNTYYSFSFCPGFWEIVVKHNHAGLLFSIDKVRDELRRHHPARTIPGSRRKEDDILIKWLKEEDLESGGGFFLSASSIQVVSCYKRIMEWVEYEKDYHRAAIAKFAGGADGWLIAFAKVKGYVVVTNEKSEPHSKRSVKIPDVCDQFQVRYENTFDMLRNLDVQLDYFG